MAIKPLDDRIVASAPACYLTTFRRLMETKGAQDAEQNIFGQIAFGMDEPDYAMMRAPKPTLICASTRDATFDIAASHIVPTFRHLAGSHIGNQASASKL